MSTTILQTLKINLFRYFKDFSQRNKALYSSCPHWSVFFSFSAFNWSLKVTWLLIVCLVWGWKYSTWCMVCHAALLSRSRWLSIVDFYFGVCHRFCRHTAFFQTAETWQEPSFDSCSQGDNVSETLRAFMWPTGFFKSLRKLRLLCVKRPDLGRAPRI